MQHTIAETTDIRRRTAETSRENESVKRTRVTWSAEVTEPGRPGHDSAKEVQQIGFNMTIRFQNRVPAVSFLAPMA